MLYIHKAKFVNAINLEQIKSWRIKIAIGRDIYLGVI